MYQDLRSGAEFGWDFSSRWFADRKSIETIETTDIIPVDLNALLYGLEEILIKAFKEDVVFVTTLKTSMEARKSFLNEYIFNTEDGTFEDFNWVEQKQTGIKSLAMTYPLFFKMSTKNKQIKLPII
tara:strand:+ start:17160 stop:17537 length:378 start_codon:yes stop_codon:yes gene_type:complete